MLLFENNMLKHHPHKTFPIDITQMTKRITVSYIKGMHGC